MKLIISNLLFVLSLNTFSLTAAILDNGIDYSHRDFKNKIKLNPNESNNSTDDDRNGYIDDIRGWNFISMNNKVFDFERDIEITDDIKLYYSLKAQKSLGTISEEDEEIYDQMKKDQDLKKRRKALTSWMHGTHVGSIAVSSNDLPKELKPTDLKALIITYLGKAEKGPAKSPDFVPTTSTSTSKRNAHIKRHWQSYLDWQINKLKISIDYAKTKAIVFNGSFGQSFKGATEMVSKVHKEQFGKELTEQQASTKATIFMKDLIKRATSLLSKYPSHLFVFSAGNKKSDTDQKLHFPSNVRLNNVISVGASFKRQTKAYFSNFANTTVDLFAPGVAISSAVPNQEYLKINGTSQAAPFVTNTSLKAFTLAKKLRVRLSPKTLKYIMMETVDKRDELSDQSVSSGLIYPERIYSTIRNIKRIGLNKAIKLSLTKWPSISIKKINNSELEGLLIDLPTN
jgi:subtilisin family serine protease